MPGDHKGADAAAAITGDGGVIGMGAEFEAVLGVDGGEEFIDQELQVGQRDAVVLIAAIEARQGVLIRGGDDAGLDEDADERRDVFLCDEIGDLNLMKQGFGKA